MQIIIVIILTVNSLLKVEATIASGKPIPSIRATNVGISSLKGRRSYMEDYCGVGHINGDPSTLYMAVFDGHGNDACAKFCANIFPKHVRERGLI